MQAYIFPKSQISKEKYVIIYKYRVGIDKTNLSIGEHIIMKYNPINNRQAIVSDYLHDESNSSVFLLIFGIISTFVSFFIITIQIRASNMAKKEKNI